MVDLNGAPKADERASLGQLVGSLAENVSTLVRDEIALAKAEINESAKRGATGGGLLGVTVGLLALIALLVTFAAVYGLSDGTGLPLWASFLIVAGVYLVIAAIVGYAGYRQLQKAQGPQRANEAMNETKQILTGLKPKVPGSETPAASGPAAAAGPGAAPTAGSGATPSAPSSPPSGTAGP
jgi:hypothetical protein